MPQPPEGTFDPPSPLDDHKTARDFRWLDPFWNPHAAHAFKGALHDLQRPAQGLLHPLLQLAFIGAVGPDVPKARKDLLEGSQEQLGSLSIGDLGRMHQDIQDQSIGSDDQMALASADLLGPIRAPLSCLLAGLDGLALENGCTGAGLPSLTQTDGLAQRGLDRLPQASEPPGAKGRPHGRPAGKIMG